MTPPLPEPQVVPIEAADPWPQRTPCLFDGCRLSVEEHHRLSRGYALDNAVLRKRLQEIDKIDLSDVSTRDLLAEVARRLEAS